MRITLLILTLMLFSSVAVASPRHKHKPAPTTFSQLVSGFTVNAGYRWDDRVTCAASNQTSPFYLGAGLALPLSDKFALCGGAKRFDGKSSEDEPVWESNIELVFSPFKR